jgi:hypothetical protein
MLQTKPDVRKSSLKAIQDKQSQFMVRFFGRAGRASGKRGIDII